MDIIKLAEQAGVVVDHQEIGISVFAEDDEEMRVNAISDTWGKAKALIAKMEANQ